MSEQATAATKMPKGRSPAYPAINLEIAIQRARQLYDRARQHPIPVDTIVNYWHYKSLNGPAAQALAALVKYGLVDDEGAGKARKARVSSLGQAILAHPDEAGRKAAIRQAALRPAIHREMWEQYGEDLPPDETLRWELTQTRGFTETGAKEFLPVYRATIAFAQLASHAPEHALEADKAELERDYRKDEQDNQPQHGSIQPLGDPRQPPPVTKSYPIPLIGGGAVTVEGKFPITEQDWDQFMAVLTAMRPGLVKVTSDVTADG